MKRFFACVALASCLPAAAQTVTATLRVEGDVRVSTGTDFVPATDKQAVLVGQRILVGDKARATVRYDAECSRSYNDPGVYTIEPGACRDQKDRKDQQQAGNVSSVGGSSLGSTLGTVLGTVIAGQQVLQHQGEKKADRALSQ